MLNRNTPYSEWLLPYLEGGLDEARRAQLEARLAEDPALADEARQLARTMGGLRGVAARAPRPENAQVPADLWPHLRARLVLDPAPRPRARAWWLAGVGAPAAAALIVTAFWLPGWHSLTRPELASKSAPAPRSAPALKSAPAAGPTAAPVARPVPVPSAAPAPAVPPPLALSPPAPPTKRVPHAKPMPAAGIKAATPDALRPVPAVPRATPFDLPVPAPTVRRAAAAPPAPVAPAAPGAAAMHPPIVVAPPPAMASTPPKPVPAAPAATTAQGQAAPSPNAIAPAVPAGGAVGSAPKSIKNGPVADTTRSAKAQPNAMRFATPPAAPAPADAPPASILDGAAGLASWQSSLAAAVRAPLWGENEGDAQANQALTSAREAGMLDDLRARLEARRAESPRDVVTGRMLAAVYDFGFSPEAALRERRRVSGLEGAVGEDWYALARAEERAGNGAAARAAYRRALESPVPPSPFHAAIARGKA